MFDYQLFLGFPVDNIYAKELTKTPETFYNQLISKEEGDHLYEFEHNGMRFIGRKIGNFTSLPQLELVEKNIYSILRKLVPNFPYEETPLYLFPVGKSE